jgi:hypothetical protein
MSCNNSTDIKRRLFVISLICLIRAFSAFLRVFHFDDDDGEDEFHTDSKKKLVLTRKGA